LDKLREVVFDPTIDEKSTFLLGGIPDLQTGRVSLTQRGVRADFSDPAVPQPLVDALPQFEARAVAPPREMLAHFLRQGISPKFNPTISSPTLGSLFELVSPTNLSGLPRTKKRASAGFSMLRQGLSAEEDAMVGRFLRDALEQSLRRELAGEPEGMALSVLDELMRVISPLGK
jgi:hypothetical protein